jgi:signal transduction histidine kinase
MTAGPRILVVDDEKRAVELLARTLRGAGRVEIAASGDDAWARLQKDEFELVISDQRMPGMTGVELLGRIAERDEHVGRILLTGYTDLEATVDAINRGRVHAYLHKPCAPDDVKLTVRSVLERVRLARDNGRLVTELAAKNQELTRTLASLREVQTRILNSERLAAIGRMIAMIAHDLRTPLSLVRASGTELLRESAALGNEALRELGDEILAETDHMVRLCSELLEVTRVSESPQLAETELDALVASAVAALHERAFASGIQLELDLEARVSLPLDPDAFQRALRNLVQNACEAMPEGGLLRVATRREGAHARIEVVDNGPGIPPEIADRLFEPFVTAGKHGGSGLGLAVVRKIVDDHGGEVSAGKPEGGGTAITIRLPLAPNAP